MSVIIVSVLGIHRSLYLSHMHILHFCLCVYVCVVQHEELIVERIICIPHLNISERTGLVEEIIHAPAGVFSEHNNICSSSGYDDER